MYALSHIQELQTLDISRPKSKPQTANPCCSGYRTAGTVEVLVPVRNVLMHHFNLPLAYLISLGSTGASTSNGTTSRRRCHGKYPNRPCK
jgi:hypothetical protein